MVNQPPASSDQPDKKGVSRREFLTNTLKGAAAGLGANLLPACNPEPPFEAPTEITEQVDEKKERFLQIERNRKWHDQSQLEDPQAFNWALSGFIKRNPEFEEKLNTQIKTLAEITKAAFEEVKWMFEIVIMTRLSIDTPKGKEGKETDRTHKDFFESSWKNFSHRFMDQLDENMKHMLQMAMFDHQLFLEMIKGLNKITRGKNALREEITDFIMSGNQPEKSYIHRQIAKSISNMDDQKALENSLMQSMLYFVNLILFKSLAKHHGGRCIIDYISTSAIVNNTKNHLKKEDDEHFYIKNRVNGLYESPKGLMLMIWNGNLTIQEKFLVLKGDISTTLEEKLNKQVLALIKHHEDMIENLPPNERKVNPFYFYYRDNETGEKLIDSVRQNPGNMIKQFFSITPEKRAEELAKKSEERDNEHRDLIRQISVIADLYRLLEKDQTSCTASNSNFTGSPIDWKIPIPSNYNCIR